MYPVERALGPASVATLFANPRDAARDATGCIPWQLWVSTLDAALRRRSTRVSPVDSLGQSKNRASLSPYCDFCACARSSGVICCKKSSRFCCAHWLVGSAAKADISQ